MDNIFLKIVRKELPSYSVYEDDSVYAFLDIKPYSKGHTLIVPKKYCPDIESLDDKTATAILMAAKKITVALRALYAYEGVVLHQVNGEKAQEVRHFHMHVYGTLPKGATHFYKTLPENHAERNEMLSTIAEEISNVIHRQ
ncbi:MAG: HIT family protein [Candidatus Roizmanbacteria bacterium]|nr:HIT family protein [Candidatus Roizmanbacteria bacterium]